MLDNLFFRQSRLPVFLQHALLHRSKESFGKVLLAQVSSKFLAVQLSLTTLLIGAKPQIFGFIIMKSGPRRWLQPDERWGTKKSWVELEQMGLV